MVREWEKARDKRVAELRANAVAASNRADKVLAAFSQSYYKRANECDAIANELESFQPPIDEMFAAACRHIPEPDAEGEW